MLGSQEGLQNNRKLAPKVQVPLAPGEGGAPPGATLEPLSQEYPASCDPRTWEQHLPPSLVLNQCALRQIMGRITHFLLHSRG